ncbi:MAG: prolipoprotein diacylglyceryl transferase [Defluviitaleaceae bacterium]|nr:prolipoprotein diacylglyceryl transferase [Defluviitaleaceae bacterium]
MFPNFTFIGRTHDLYTLLGVVAIVIGATIASFRAKKYNFNSMDIILAAVAAGIGILLGGSALMGITQIPRIAANWEFYSSDLIHMFATMFRGMVFYGGLFGAFFGFWAYCRIFKKSYADILRIAVPVLPLSHAIMRLGCFMAGCCHGIEHSTLGIAFTRAEHSPNGIPFLPVPLYESAMNLTIFAFVWHFSKKERKPLYLLSAYLIPYAIGRFALEFLRGDAVRGMVFNLSTSQFISVLIVSGCAVALIADRFLRKASLIKKG